MSTAGSNLPEFRSVQLDFAAHIRDPRTAPVPPGVEPRRMKIYADLFFNNIKSFLDSAFPVSREVIGEAGWIELARDFLHHHASESPYFLQISEEFLTYLHGRGLDGLPPFLLELCHYEWVELALDVAVEETDPDEYLVDGDFTGELVISRLVRPLTYDYPVHEIGVKNQPQHPPTNPTYLLVYRNADLKVRFIVSNPVTHRLLGLLESMTAEDAFSQIRSELADSGRVVSQSDMQKQGMKTINQLHNTGIILGSKALNVQE